MADDVSSEVLTSDERLLELREGPALEESSRKPDGEGPGPEDHQARAAIVAQRVREAMASRARVVVQSPAPVALPRLTSSRESEGGAGSWKSNALASTEVSTPEIRFPEASDSQNEKPVQEEEDPSTSLVGRVRSVLPEEADLGVKGSPEVEQRGDAFPSMPVVASRPRLVEASDPIARVGQGVEELPGGESSVAAGQTRSWAGDDVEVSRPEQRADDFAEPTLQERQGGTESGAVEVRPARSGWSDAGDFVVDGRRLARRESWLEEASGGVSRRGGEGFAQGWGGPSRDSARPLEDGLGEVESDSSYPDTSSVPSESARSASGVGEGADWSGGVGDLSETNGLLRQLVELMRGPCSSAIPFGASSYFPER